MGRIDYEDWLVCGRSRDVIQALTGGNDRYLDAEDKLLLGYAFFNEKAFDEAISIAQQIDNRASGKLLLALCFVAMGDADKARGAATAIESDERGVRLAAELWIAASVQDWSHTSELAEQILELPEVDPWALVVVAMLGFIESDPRLLRRASLHVCGHPRSQTLLSARIYAELLEGKKLASSLHAALQELTSEAYRPNAMTCYVVGRYFFSVNELEEARSWLTRSFERFEGDYEVPAYLACVELRLGHLNQSVQWANQALALRPHGQRAMRCKVVALARMRRFGLAVATFLKWRRAWRRMMTEDAEGNRVLP
jgi:tetratricopeptide (TPR) repeat protein